MKDKELDLNEENLKFIEKLGIYYENYGIPRIGGRILALILVANNYVSSEQISKLLKVSRGSISTNVRLLVSYGLLEKTSIAGDRSDYFVICESAWDNAIKTRIEGFENLKGILEEGNKSFNSESNSNIKLKEMLQWVNIMTESNEKALIEWRREIKIL